MAAEATFWRSPPVTASCWWTAALRSRSTRSWRRFGANAKVNTLFNTHHHVDQTGNNEMFSTRRRRSSRTSAPWSGCRPTTGFQADDRYEKARPKAARPTETFLTTGSLKAGGEQIDYGYLPLAHTERRHLVHFRNANVLAVGDVASPLRDPALDYFTGAWIGGRVDAMDVLLTLANEQTRIVPAYGPVMSKAEFKAERDMMEEVRKPPVQAGSRRRRPQGHAGGAAF